MCTSYRLGKGSDLNARTNWEKNAVEFLNEQATDLVRPTNQTAIVINAHSEPILGRWGFARPFNSSIVNTRTDKLLDPNSIWSKAWRNRQICLIPTYSFYEFSGPKGNKQCYHIRPSQIADDHLLWIAGIYEESRQHGICYSMITTEPSGQMAKVHNRMPHLLTFSETQEIAENKGSSLRLTPYEGALTISPCPSPLRKGNTATQGELF